MRTAARGLLWSLLPLAAAVAWLALTESGLHWAWRLARPLLSATVSVDSVSGRLVGPLTVRGLRVDHDDGGLTLARATRDWRPTRLLAGEIAVSRLALDGLEYTAPEAPADEASTTPSPAFELPTLPLPLVVAGVEARDLAYAPAPDAEPRRLAMLGWTALRLDAAGLALDGGRVRDPRLTADLDLTLGRGADGQVAAQADWRLRPPDRPPLAGRLEVDGSRQHLRLDAGLAPPYSATLEATVREAFAAPAFELALDAREAGTAAWLGERPDGLPETLGLHLDAAGTWNDGILTLERAELAQRDSGARLRADGPLATAGDGTDLRLAWTELRWPLTGEAMFASPDGTAAIRGGPGDWRGELRAAVAPSGTVTGELRLADETLDGSLAWNGLVVGPVTSPAGELRFDGRPDDYRIDLNARGRHAQAGDFRLALSGRGDRAHLAVADLRAELLDGVVTGTGEVAWQPVPRFDARLRGRGLDPGRLDSAWPGRLDVALVAGGRREGDVWRARIAELTAEGRLRGRDLRVRGAGEWDGNGLLVRDLEAASGGSTLSADGRIGGRWDLRWSLDSPDLAELVPGATGTLSGRGTVRGRIEALALRGQLDGEDLRFREWATDSLSAEADVELSGERAASVAVRAAAVRAAGGRWDIRLDGDGRPADHRVEIAATAATGEREGRLTVTGDWRRPDWRGRLTDLRLAPGIGPAWTLADSAGLDYRQGRFRLERGCLTADNARACVGLNAEAGKVDGRLDVTALPLALAELVLPPGAEVEGTVSADGDFGYREGAPRLDLAFTTTAVTVRATAFEEETATLGIAPGGGRVRLAPDGGAVAFDFALRPAGRLHADIRLGPGADLDARTLDGEIVVRLPDLSPLAALSPELDSLSGRVDGSLRLAGTVGTPAIDGELALVEGRAVLPRPGLTLTGVELRLAGDGDSLALSGAAHSGEGRLALSGRLHPAPPPSLALSVTGEDFRVFDTRDGRVAVSPDLELRLDGRRAEVRGLVRIPDALITPRDIDASGAVPVSRDQVIVAEGETAPPLRLDAEVRIELGEEVRVEAFGLKADLGGALTLRQQPGRLATGTGELQVEEGEYRAYGQGLKIETGRLLFTGGPVDDPGLDVRAVRRPREDVTVGVLVRGSLREPDFRLFSEPAMSQTAQRSWLVLGRPREQTSGGESSALAQAAIGLGRKGGDFLGRRLQDTLGLDTLGVESEAGGPRDQASFVIGKYLSPKLYVSYGIGLFEPVNVLKLRYEISRRWTLLTESGTESGGDITYSIER